MEDIDYYSDKVKPGRETRLYNEWKMMDVAFSSNDVHPSHSADSSSPHGIDPLGADSSLPPHDIDPLGADSSLRRSPISYTITKRSPSGLPLAYEITFHIQTITGVEQPDAIGLQKPVFGDTHILRITIPNNYPSADGGYPDFKFVTDVWHPNIRFYGEFKGHVCLNFENCGTSTPLVEFISKVAAYLRYDEYHALDEEPYPEDQTVARWVREQAEPQGWLEEFRIRNLELGIKN